MQTDWSKPKNTTDININVNERGTCLLIDVPISGGRNVIKKVVEMILKCKDFIIEI
jgi:hypothetical protein